MSEVQVRQTPDIIQQVNASQSGLAAALADRIGVERFTRAAVTVLRTTPALSRCTPESVLGGLFVAAQLGLEIGGPRAYAHLVPYGRDAQLIVGYKGYVELFYRAGARAVTADIVREGDVIEQATDETGRTVIHWKNANPLDTDRAPVGALAVVVLASGEVLQNFMTKAQILKRKPRTSKAGPWSDWEEEMWLKTVLRDTARTARLSSDDLALAVQADQSITTGTGETAKRRHVEVGEAEFEPVTVAELTALVDAELDPAHPDYVASADER
ncbi:MAG TPA: recombinase RecT [Microbacteriaceae bacterium]|nr:recombinase RecT [Microbacteriaceae bacterium]